MNVLVASTPIEAYFFLTDEEFALDTDDIEALACYDASCRPPTSGGTGGSSKKGGGSSSAGASAGSYKVGGGDVADKDMALLRGGERVAGETVNGNGTLSQEHMNEDGTFNFSDKDEAKILKQWGEQGLDRDEMRSNLVAAGISAIGKDTAKTDSEWYTYENQEWAAGLAERTGVTPDVIFAATSVTSALRRWPENKVVVERLIDKLAKDEPFEITQKMADEYNAFNAKAKFGVTPLEAGTYKPSDMSSAVMARLATGLGWKVANLIGTRPVFQAIAVIRKEIEPNELIHGPKQRSFHSNLAHPEASFSVTNDFWACRALVGDKKLILPDNGVNPDNTKINPAKGARKEVTMREWETTPTKYLPNGDAEKGNIANAILKNSLLYADAARITIEALDTLKATDVRFKDMKPHEFQALLWVNQQRLYEEKGWV